MNLVNIIFGISLVFLSSCSSKATRISPQAENKGSDAKSTSGKKRPGWVDDAQTECFSVKEICAVGEGVGKMEALAKAQKEIAAQFESSVSSKTKTASDSEEQSKGDKIIDSDFREWVSEEINTLTEDIMLKGVEIKKSFAGEESYFVLAALDKRKNADMISSEIENYDEKMLSLLREKKRIHYRTLLKNYQARERLNDHYQVLSGSRIRKKVSYDQIFNLSRVDQQNAPIILVQVTSSFDKGVKEMEGMIIKSLIDANYKVTTKEASKYDVHLTSTLSSEKLFLNVEGFEKFKFILSLKTQKGSEEIGKLVIEQTQVGRSQSQAFELALKEFNKELIEENKLSELNLN